MSYAARIVPALQDLRDQLTAAGVPASLDRARMQVPGAWVTPASVGGFTLSGAAELTAAVLLVAPAGGDEAPLTVLTGLLERAMTVLTPDEDVDTSVVLSVRSNSLPAFKLAVTIDLQE